MKDKEVKLEEIEVSPTLGGTGKGHVPEGIGSEEGTRTTSLSDTLHCPYGHSEVLRRIVWYSIDGCRYNERLNSTTEGSELLTYTGLHG